MSSSRDGSVEDGTNEEGGGTSTEIPAPGGSLKPVTKMTPKERTMGILGIAAVGSAVAGAVFTAFSAVACVAGVVSAGVGGYAYYQQTRLTDIIALKETHEAFMNEINNLKAENERLAAAVEDLGSTVGRLEDVEDALDVITQTQGQSVETFAQQVKENKQILNQMKKNLKANVLTNLLQVVIRSDTDGDNKIDDDELEDLVEHLNQINGVELNEERFRAAIIESGGSIKSVMKVVKNLLSEDVTEEERIFKLQE